MAATYCIFSTIQVWNASLIFLLTKLEFGKEQLKVECPSDQGPVLRIEPQPVVYRSDVLDPWTTIIETISLKIWLRQKRRFNEIKTNKMLKHQLQFDVIFVFVD